jgi:hypothetical protein
MIKMGEKLRISGLKRYEKIKDVLVCGAIIHQDCKEVREHIYRRTDMDMGIELIQYLKINEGKCLKFDFEIKESLNDEHEIMYEKRLIIKEIEIEEY